MYLEHLLENFSNNKSILLLDGDLLEQATTKLVIKYVFIVNHIVNNKVKLIPIYITDDHFIIEILEDNTYKYFDYQFDAIASVKSKLKFLTFDSKNFAYDFKSESLIISVNQNVGNNYNLFINKTFNNSLVNKFLLFFNKR